MTDPRQTGEMPFLEHLEELRKVLIQCVIAVAIGGLAGWWFAPRILEDVIRRTVRHVIVLSPMEALNERLKLTVVLGLLITLPFVLYKVWNFVVPGLMKRERSLIGPMVAASVLLFALGGAAAYGYVVPLVIHVLSGFMTPSMEAQIQVGPLLSMVYNLTLSCGLVFQLPLVTMALTALGLVTPGALLRQWRVAVVVTFLVTALVTPGDVVTAQLVMGVPMTLLYFLSVGLSWLVARRRRQRSTATIEEGGRA